MGKWIFPLQFTLNTLTFQFAGAGFSGFSAGYQRNILFVGLVAIF
jgi:hypothetical protein